MKVLCINDKPMFDKPDADWLIKLYEVYDVIGVCNTNYGIYYELSIQPGVAYTCENFIPLSNIDETEIIKQREETYA